MKMLKITAIILTAAAVLALAACGGMNAQTGEINLDISKAVKSIAGFETVKVWLVAEGTNNFVIQGAEPETDGSTVTLDGIPAGYNYTIYISLGSGTGDGFTAASTASGSVYVSSSGSTADLTASAIETVSFTNLEGKALKGVELVGANIFAADASNVYYGSNSASAAFTAAASTAGEINDISKGITNTGADMIYLSIDASDTNALVEFDPTAHTYDDTFSDGLAAKLDASVTDLEILASDVFISGSKQAIVSQIDGGFVISTIDNATNPAWYVLNLNDFLTGLDFSVTGKLLRGLTGVDNGSTVSVVMASKVGNFRKTVPWDLAGTISEDLGDSFPTSTSSLYLERILDIDNSSASPSTMYLATSNGLWTATLKADADPDAGGDQVLENEAQIAVTDGKRVSMVECGADYTAGITPFELVIVENGTGGSAEVITFNAGLPAKELLTDEAYGITDLYWEGNTLYVAGYKGLVSIDADTLFTN